MTKGMCRSKLCNVVYLKKKRGYDVYFFLSEVE